MQLDIKNYANRKLVYQSIKEKYEKWLGTPGYLRDCNDKPNGLCIELDNAADMITGNRQHYYFISDFPEIIIFKPYANKESAYWFPLEDEGIWKRVSILYHAIRMVDYPWTIPFYKLVIRFKLIRLGL